VKSSIGTTLSAIGSNVIVWCSDGSRSYAASTSSRPQPKWLFGTLPMPPHPAALFGTVTAGFALRVRSHFVRGTSRTRLGRADHSRATDPTTCGLAIDVPLMFP
jgi:hypothetical protein